MGVVVDPPPALIATLVVRRVVGEQRVILEPAASRLAGPALPSF
jgi:hypothetical protein